MRHSKHIKNLLLLGCGFYFLQSCTNLTLRLPAARFESPESNGKLWRTGFGTYIAGDHEVTVISNAASRPPVTDQCAINRDAQSSFFLNMGVASFVDLELRAGLSGSEFLAKIQLLGASVRDAQEGNFSIAASIAGGSGSVSNSGDQATLFGPGNATWNANASYFSQDFALIFGYRISDTLLIFGGPFWTNYNSTANIHQDAVTSPASPAADYNLTQAGSNNGGNLAIQAHFSKERRWSFTFEEVYSNLKWTNATSTTDFTTSFVLGYLF